MTSATSRFRASIAAAADNLIRSAPASITILHHNDADGLSSAAAILEGLSALPSRIIRICLERTYHAVLERVCESIATEQHGMLILADFGSGALGRLMNVVRGRFPVLVLDHHAIESCAHEGLLVINPLECGIPATECSASTLCALFARALNPRARLSPLYGVIGAVGDGMFDAQGGLAGVNAEVLALAKNDGLVSSQLELRIPAWKSAEVGRVASMLTTAGGLGYLQGGPEVGLAALRTGDLQPLEDLAAKFEKSFRDELANVMRSSPIQIDSSIASIRLPQLMSQYGVKSVGLVCESLRDSQAVPQESYLVGFQHVPSEIPGLGKFDWKQLKVSLRLGRALERLVQERKRPALTTVLGPAVQAVRGETDASHPHAAAAIIPTGSEDRFIKALQAEIQKHTGT